MRDLNHEEWIAFKVKLTLEKMKKQFRLPHLNIFTLGLVVFHKGHVSIYKHYAVYFGKSWCEFGVN